MESIDRYVKVLSGILATCESYKDALKENTELRYKGEDMEILGVFMDQDMTASIYILYRDGQFRYVFGGSWFGFSNAPKQPSLEDVAKEVQHIGAPTEDLVRNFKRSLVKPLGTYLAEQELHNLETALLSV
ncbi:MAG TPA: hypothetical protein VJH20_02595 [Candidatus Nanoarchaeia archaeon]|nr:hypothetical protein [Candidatus Nanoarchaeia archaeon]